MYRFSSRHLISAALIAAAAILPSAVEAQFYANSATIEIRCVGIGVELEVIHTVSDDYPSEWVGWYVERETVGLCLPREMVCDVTPFPTVTGQTTFVLTDDPAYGHNVLYRTMARTADGGSEQLYTGARAAFFHCNCPGGPAFRGTVHSSGGGFLYLTACPDECWYEPSYLDTSVPADLAGLADTGAVIDAYGTLATGMEGTRLDIDIWQESYTGCTAVARDPDTWGSVKAMYR